MPIYYLSTITSAHPQSGRFTPVEVEARLRRRWPAIQVEHTSSPADAWRMTWSLQLDTGSVRGALFHNYYALMLTGEPDACLEVAAWYLDQIFAPTIFGRHAAALLSEHDGDRARTITVRPDVTPAQLAQALAARRFRFAPMFSEVSCSISTIHTGTFPEDVLSPEAFSAALQAAWPTALVQLTRDPHNPAALRWQALIEGTMIQGRLGRAHHQVWFTGAFGACAIFASWYRALIPAFSRIGFTIDQSPIWVELVAESSPLQIESAFSWVPAHTGRIERPYRPPALPLIIGDHMGRISADPQDAGFAAGSLGRTASGEVWYSDRSTLRVFRDQRWYAVSNLPRESTPEGLVWFQGQLWAASAAGALAYDGRAWRAVDGHPALKSAHALATDLSGALWLADDSGIWRSPDGEQWEQVALLEGFSQAHGLFSDGQGGITTVAWHAHQPVALLSWRGRGWEIAPPPPWNRYQAIHAIVREDDGSLLAGTATGLWRFHAGAWAQIQARHRDRGALLVGPIVGIARDQRGRLWVAGYRGLQVQIDEAWQPVLLAPRAPSDEQVVPFVELQYLCATLLDPHGRLWLATLDRQLAWIDTTQALITDPSLTRVPLEPTPLHGEPLMLAAPPALPSPHPSVALEPAALEPHESVDTADLLPWHAPAQEQPDAAWQIAGAYIATALVPDAPGSLMSFARTDDQQLYAILAPYGTLYRATPAGWSEVALPGDVHGAVACWSLGAQLWVSGTGTQLLRYADGSWTQLPSEEWLGANPFARTIDRSQRMWLGTTTRGICTTSDGEHWETIDLPEPMIVGPIWSDGAGTLLVAELGKRPAGHPIWRYQGGVWEPIPLPTKRASLVYGLAMQRSQDLWVATSAGLWRRAGATWERTRVSRRATRAGLPGEAHGPLWVDALDRVWASTDAGIAAHADGAWWRVAITLGGKSSEPTPETWGIAQVSALATHLDAQGRLWLGLASGEIGYIDTAQPLHER